MEDEAGRAIFPFHLEVDRTLEHAVAPDRQHLELRQWKGKIEGEDAYTVETEVR